MNPLGRLEDRVALGSDVEIGEDVQFGSFVVVHDGVRIGDGCVIQDGAVLGKSPRLGAHSSAPVPPESAPLVIDAGVTICCHAVICAGGQIGSGAVVGDQSFLREGVRIGSETVVGQGSAIGRGVQLGDRVRLQNQVVIAPGSVLEDDVFFGPAVMVTNDLSTGRSAQTQVEVRGVMARRACRVGASVVLLPGIEIGEEALVGAGSVVTRSVAARTVVRGAPAKAVRRVDPRDELESSRGEIR